MLAELKELFRIWIAAVAAAIHGITARVAPQRRIEFEESDGGGLTARSIVSRKDKALPPAAFHLVQDRPEPPLSAEWRAALRGSRIDIRIRPDQVLFRSIDFPKQAADFLVGMVCAQIDRLTPWIASEAVFGLTRPEPAGYDRIAVTLAATSEQKVQPLIRLAAAVGAASVTGTVIVAGSGQAAEPVTLFDRPLTTSLGVWVDAPRLLRRVLLGAGLATVAVLALSAYFGDALDAEQQELQLRLTQRRAALRLNQVGGAEALLAKRKQASPSSVMVLEAISRGLPDNTYVSELRIEGDKMQVVGLSQDAPSLIKLLEQSPQFARATFFAPTTHAADEPAERFHIEAHITPYFGSGT